MPYERWAKVGYKAATRRKFLPLTCRWLACYFW